VSEASPLDGAGAAPDPVEYDGDIAAAEEVFTDEGGDETPARQYVEVDDPDNRYVRVKVAGEDVEVPYSEAVRGYSREADYTRKAQEVAAQRQEAELGLRIQQALATDPQTTLRLLAERYAAQNPAAPKAPEPEFDDPLERQLHEERQARMSLEERINQREADEQLSRTIDGLRTQYGANDEDLRAAVNLAYQSNLGIEQLPMIYKTMAFDRIQANVRAYQAQQAAEAAKNQQRTAAKQAAGQVISNGNTGATNLTDRASTGAPMSLRESIEAAFEQAGM
jgi:hypothetical protein